MKKIRFKEERKLLSFFNTSSIQCSRKYNNGVLVIYSIYIFKKEIALLWIGAKTKGKHYGEYVLNQFVNEFKNDYDIKLFALPERVNWYLRNGFIKTKNGIDNSDGVNMIYKKER